MTEEAHPERLSIPSDPTLIMHVGLDTTLAMALGVAAAKIRSILREPRTDVYLNSASELMVIPWEEVGHKTRKIYIYRRT